MGVGSWTFILTWIVEGVSRDHETVRDSFGTMRDRIGLEPPRRGMGNEPGRGCSRLKHAAMCSANMVQKVEER